MEAAMVWEWARAFLAGFATLVMSPDVAAVAFGGAFLCQAVTTGGEVLPPAA
jgi:hypothetical protein